MPDLVAASAIMVMTFAMAAAFVVMIVTFAMAASAFVVVMMSFTMAASAFVVMMMTFAVAASTFVIVVMMASASAVTGHEYHEFAIVKIDNGFFAVRFGFVFDQNGNTVYFDRLVAFFKTHHLENRCSAAAGLLKRSDQTVSAVFFHNLLQEFCSRSCNCQHWENPPMPPIVEEL